MIVRGLRLTGVIDDARLLAAAQEVAASLGPPAAFGVRAQTVAGEGQCLELLAAQGGCGGIQLCRLPAGAEGGQVVLAVAGDRLLLDLRSVYLLLGAVMQAYFGRFRTAEYPSYADTRARIAHTAPPSRVQWWAGRIRAWHQPWRPVTDMRSAAVHLPFDRWTRLCAIGDHMGNRSSIAVVALLAWWLRLRQGRRHPPVFLADLDLREYHGLGPVIGPLTDRVAFEVDVAEGLSFRDLVRRCHAGLLDAVVHYLPFAAMSALPGWQGCDVAVHYCRTPPLSSATRGEQTLARLGLSVELFQEAELARLSHRRVDGVGLAVDVAESGDGVELIGMPLEHPVIDKVIADPDIPLARL